MQNFNQRIQEYYRSSDLRTKLSLFVAVICLGINTVLLVWYIFYGYQDLFHSDSAVKVLLAREIMETGSFFPGDWNYANGDLFVGFGHLLILPLLAFLPAGYLVHAISGIISSLFVLSGVWLVTALSEAGTVRRLFIVAIAAAGFSGLVVENLYGQVSYGPVVYFSCYILFFAWKYIQSEGNHKKYFGVALVFILALVFWFNPQRALIAYLVPLLCSVLYSFRSSCSEESDNFNKMSGLLAFIVIGVVFGVVLHAVTLSGVHNVDRAVDIRWLSFDGMLVNASLVLKQILVIFNGLVHAGDAVISVVGFYGLVRLISVIVLLFLVSALIKNRLSENADGTAFAVVFALSSFLLVLFLQVTTTLPDMSDPVQSSRYLIPSLILLAVLALVEKYDISRSPVLFMVSIVVSFVFVLSSYTVYLQPGLSFSIEDQWGQSGHLHRNAKGLADFLIQHGLQYGYGSYWNAGVLTVLSNEKVRVRQIVIADGLPVPNRFLSSDRWYCSQAWTGKTFLLLTEQEVALTDFDKMADFGVTIDSKLEFGSFRIFVFKQNIAGKIPGWDEQYSASVLFPVTKHSRHHIGRLVEDYDDQGAVLVAGKGEVGPLHFGPYINVAPGCYKITFHVAALCNSKGVFRLDIAAEGGRKLYAEKTFPAGNGMQEFVVQLEKRQNLEFRVWVLGNEQVVFRGVDVVRVEDLQM